MISLQQVGAEQVVIFLKGTPEKLQGGMQRAFARIAIRLQQYIVQQKLSGQVLHHKSGKLASSVIQRVETTEGRIAAIVQAGGLAVSYAGVHEYGGTFQIPEHLSVSRSGKQFTVHAHSATYPERSYMRTSLDENTDMFLEEVSKAIGDALK
jgi:phage gpG-like protein